MYSKCQNSSLRLIFDCWDRQGQAGTSRSHKHWGVSLYFDQVLANISINVHKFVMGKVRASQNTF
jgi:hypothetical protein